MEIKKDAWDKFLESMDVESPDSNFKYDFVYMTKKYGVAYIEFCKAAWSANEDVLTEEEFMTMNGGMPRKFFEARVNGVATSFEN
jgi:hypothetical protein